MRWAYRPAYGMAILLAAFADGATVASPTRETPARAQNVEERTKKDALVADRFDRAGHALEILAALRPAGNEEPEASPFLPPGHGGTPPGHGGVPPGHTTPPGHGSTPPGQAGTAPGQGGGPSPGQRR